MWSGAGEPKCKHSTVRKQRYNKNKVFILKAGERKCRPGKAEKLGLEAGNVGLKR